jgi:hypothetical protein
LRWHHRVSLIGAACGADIYLGTNVSTGEEVAMKLESTNSKHPQLVYEAKLYKILQGAVGASLCGAVVCCLRCFVAVATTTPRMVSLTMSLTLSLLALPPTQASRTSGGTASRARTTCW